MEYELPFTLHSDPQTEIVRAYNVGAPGHTQAQQVTYLVGRDVLRIYQKLDPKRHVAQLIEDLQKTTDMSQANAQ